MSTDNVCDSHLATPFAGLLYAVSTGGSLGLSAFDGMGARVGGRCLEPLSATPNGSLQSILQESARLGEIHLARITLFEQGHGAAHVFQARGPGFANNRRNCGDRLRIVHLLG